MGVEQWFRRSAWRALIVDLRRAPGDAQARTRLRRAAIIPLYLLYLLGLQIFYFKTADYPAEAVIQLVLSTLFFGSIGFYAWWSERRDRRMAEERSPSVATQIKVAVYREALLLATLLERGASERALEKELPPSIEVITRRVLFDRLRDQGMLEGLNPGLLSLLLASDGHWSEEQKGKAESAWEYMEVMHWTLGLGDLNPLPLSPEYRIAMIRKVVDVKNAEKLSVLASWDIRPIRNEADVYLGRCWVELIERGVVGGLDSHEIEQAMEIKTEILTRNPQGHYIAGVNTIEELPGDALWYVALRAYRRWQILSELVNVLCGDEQTSVLRKLIEDSFSDTSVTSIAVNMDSSDQTNID
jgi:hypothetical protein